MSILSLIQGFLLGCMSWLEFLTFNKFVKNCCWLKYGSEKRRITQPNDNTTNGIYVNNDYKSRINNLKKGKRD